MTTAPAGQAPNTPQAHPWWQDLAAIPDVHLPLTLTALTAVSHGAGLERNVQRLRTRDIITPSGRRTAVPYVSGNSLRHTLRAAAAWHLLRTLGVPQQSLSKAVVDLLFSGGALTATGHQADLERSRAVHRLLPLLGLFGYSAGSGMVSGTLWADDIDLVCAENAARLPPRLADHPHAQLPDGALRTEEFATRHDTATTAVGRFLSLVPAPENTDKPKETKEPTNQMIFETQVIKAGATLYTNLRLAAPTAGHVLALNAALAHAAPEEDGRRVIALGGKRARGHGQCAVTGLGDIDHDQVGAYEAHMIDHRGEILELLSEITS